jgi:phenylalanyl-tRNA synthetase beta chain
MSTDASYRFERGIDRHGMPAALARGVELIRAVAGGDEPEPAIDLCPAPPPTVTVFLRPERVEHLLGVPVPRPEIEQLLVSVGFAVAPKDGRLAVQVPGWRPDVTREVDLIEEVARLRGYDTFPVELRPQRPTTVPADPIEPLKARLVRVLTALGLHEVVSVPFGPETDGAPAIRNPLSAEEGFLRTALLPGLVRAVERNWAERERNVRLFEIGTVFRAGAPDERVRVGAVVTGARTPPHWTASGHTPDVDAWELKGILEETLRVGGPPGGVIEPRSDGWRVIDPSGAARGEAGVLAADRPPWAGLLYGLELDVVVADRPPVTFRPLPDTPAVARDVALVLPSEVTAAQVETVLRRVGQPLLESLAVFDEYRATDLPGRSVAWRLVFRDPRRTLRDEEVDRVVSRGLRALEEELDVRLRAS